MRQAKKKVIGYVCSSLKEQSAGFTLESQITLLEAFARRHGLDIVGVVRDVAEPLTPLDHRVGGAELLRIAREDTKHLDGVLVLNAERLSGFFGGWRQYKSQFTDRGLDLHIIEPTPKDNFAGILKALAGRAFNRNGASAGKEFKRDAV